MKLLLQTIAMFALMTNMSFAQAPTPTQVSSQVSSLWQNNQITQLDQYITNLIDQNPNYVPAIVAASFQDAIFKGKLTSAKVRLDSIKTDSDANAGKYNDDFLSSLGGLIKELDYEIAMHARHGTSESALEAKASASAVRNAWGSNIPQQILILQISDAVSL